MSESYTHSNSNTYTESRARYVMDKIFDDFHAIGLRGFEYFKNHPEKLKEWKEDLFFLMTKKALEKFQMQFFSGEQEWAVEFVIKADNTIYQDVDSGGIDYWDIPSTAKPNIVVSRDRSRKEVNDYMTSRGWSTGGSYIEGDSIDDGAYSKDGYGATKTRKGSWEQ